MSGRMVAGYVPPEGPPSLRAEGARATPAPPADGGDVARPGPPPPDGSEAHFTFSAAEPRAVAWFGFRAFWSHLRHFVASAIATEDIDSRDWMHPDNPARLVDRMARGLGGARGRESLVESLGRDVWVDFLADTGDCAAVSAAVGRLWTATYDLPDPARPGEWVRAPRGDVLLFGGDTAYPVASAREIHDRLCVPFNRALAARRDGRPRIVMGIPGNHDWYDGLDGFARVFRKRLGEIAPETELGSVVSDRESKLGHVAEWAEKFVVGKHVTKRKTLVLDGYAPVQYASYFLLPLAPRLHLYGVDRQLRALDFRQRKFFAHWRAAHPEAAPVILTHDPVYTFSDPNPPGLAVVRALELRPERERYLFLSGDIHHYERLHAGESVYVTAGGGGAGLHPARVAPRPPVALPQVAWPGPRFSRRLLGRVPWHVATGRAGLIPHALCFAFFAPALGIGLSLGSIGAADAASVVAAVAGTIMCALMGNGWRRGRFGRVALLAVVAGIAMGLLPTATTWGVARALAWLDISLAPGLYALLELCAAVFFGAFAFGAYLAALTATGLEHGHAFAALAHPGFKHFVRMRARADGSALDLWCIGLVDPLAPDATPVLVDAFTWEARPPAGDDGKPPPSRSSLGHVESWASL
jgi:hypothetical protein